MSWAETVVIGGGPAGSAVACELARAGRDVMLIERTAKPHHKVCGEFLSVETCTQLQRLGVDPSALGAAPIERVTVHSSSRSVSSELPFRALSLSRYRLDDALLRRAQGCGARLVRNVAAKSVMPSASGWNVLCADGEAIQCRHLVVATGKLGLRGIDDTRDGSMVGLKMHLRPSSETRRALMGRVELFFLDNSYIGLELIEDGIANLCLVMPRATMSRLGPGWHALHGHLASALPSLAERLAGAEPLWTSRWPWSVPPVAIFIASEKPPSIVSATGSLISRLSLAMVSRLHSHPQHWRPNTFGWVTRLRPIRQRHGNSRQAPSGWQASSPASPDTAAAATCYLGSLPARPAWSGRLSGEPG